MNQNFVISGVNGYLTSHFVEYILSEGGSVFGIDKNKNKLFRHEKLFFYKVDLEKEDQVNNFYQKIKSNKIDVLINAAAIDPKVTNERHFNSFVNYPLNRWKKTININLNGAFLLSKYICKIFEKNKFNGKIINVSSVYGEKPPNQNIYSKKNIRKVFKPLEYGISKSALHSFTKSLAVYYNKTNIRVNTLTPGGVKKKDQNNNFVKNYSDRTIVGRMANLNDYDDALDFLCSKNNNYLNGSNIIVDGGLSIS